MAALTTSRDTRERTPKLREYEAGATIYAGALVALNAAGKAVPAADAAGLVVIGRAEHDAIAPADVTDATAHIPTSVRVAAGCFRYANSADHALALANVKTDCYVEDDQTVGSNGGTNSVVAGKVFDVDAEGVWVVVGY